MNKQTQEALKMAIKALEMWDKKHIIEMKVGERWIDLSYAINACKEALEQPTVAELNNEYLRDTNVIGLEQPAQEPVMIGVDFAEIHFKKMMIGFLKDKQICAFDNYKLQIQSWINELEGN